MNKILYQSVTCGRVYARHYKITALSHYNKVLPKHINFNTTIYSIYEVMCHLFNDENLDKKIYNQNMCVCLINKTNCFTSIELLIVHTQVKQEWR